jgi:hypothetical protein
MKGELKKCIESFYNFKPYRIKSFWDLEVVVTLRADEYVSELKVYDHTIARLKYWTEGKYKLEVFFYWSLMKKRWCDVYNRLFRDVKTFIDKNFNASVELKDYPLYCITINNNKYATDGTETTMNLIYRSSVIDVYAQAVKAVLFDDDEELRKLHHEFSEKIYEFNDLMSKLDNISAELKKEFHRRYDYLMNVVIELVQNSTLHYIKWDKDVESLKNRIRDAIDIMKYILIPRAKEYLSTAKILNA